MRTRENTFKQRRTLENILEQIRIHQNKTRTHEDTREQHITYDNTLEHRKAK